MNRVVSKKAHAKARQYRRGVVAIASSGAFFAALGSSIASIPISALGAIVFAVTGVLTAFNEFRLARRKHSPDRKRFASRRRRGLAGILIEKAEAPGLAPTVQCLSYLYTFLVAFCLEPRHDAGSLASYPFQTGSIFLIFAIGAAASVRLANRDFIPSSSRVKIPAERTLIQLWHHVPEKLRNVLLDPGVTFCAGNIWLVGIGMDWTRVANASLLAQFLVGCGVALALTGVLRGIAPLVSSTGSLEARGTAQLLGGFGELALGTSSLVFGSVYIGTATIVWGISSILFGVRVENLRRGGKTPS